MFAILLCTLLRAASATPPPLPDDGPPRIDGLHRTYVTPSTFVDGLRPSVPAEGLMAVVIVQPNAPSDTPAIREALASDPSIASVTEDAPQLVVRLHGAWRDLSGLMLADGRKLDEVAALGAVPRVRLPLPASSEAVPGRPLPAVPLQLPGSSTSPLRPPTPPADAPEAATGWDLRILNRHVGGLTKIEVEGVQIGEAAPLTTVTLRDVQPGLYRVVFHTPSGLLRSTMARPTQRTSEP